MNVRINGQARELAITEPATLKQLLDALELKGDRIAVERNGIIVRRPEWEETTVSGGDSFEIVHFVGGGLG